MHASPKESVTTYPGRKNPSGIPSDLTLVGFDEVDDSALSEYLARAVQRLATSPSTFLLHKCDGFLSPIVLTHAADDSVPVSVYVFVPDEKPRLHTSVYTWKMSL